VTADHLGGANLLRGAAHAELEFDAALAVGAIFRAVARDWRAADPASGDATVGACSGDAVGYAKAAVGASKVGAPTVEAFGALHVAARDGARCVALLGRPG
jgi:hypothetical protein